MARFPRRQKAPSDPVVNITEAFIGVALTSFMALVVFFFATLLLIEPPEHGLGLRTPLVFLFFAASGFIFATLIYANASGEIARLNKNNFDRQMIHGNSISEFVGVYGLIFAIPIAILEHSSDKGLALLVYIFVLAGLVLYHGLGYALIQRYFPTSLRAALTALVALLLSGVFFTAYYHLDAVHQVVSIASLAVFSVFLIVGLRSETET